MHEKCNLQEVRIQDFKISNGCWVLGPLPVFEYTSYPNHARKVNGKHFHKKNLFEFRRHIFSPTPRLIPISFDNN
jgi:hypothetical protein